jgi:predicted transcriptional regulator of viral defense system
MASKADLAALIRSNPTGLITVPAAKAALDLPSEAAASRRLAALTRLGWLTRARRGLYAIVPLSASPESATSEDSWILATRCFAPCYIGGWSAAEHWELTEQLFRSTFVATAATIRRSRDTVLGADFQLARISRDRVHGLTHVWRGTERVPVSGPERTIVDAARDPAWVGGTRHLGGIIETYCRRKGANFDLLAKTLREFGNGAAAKRLGFLVESHWPSAVEVIDAAAEMKTAGAIKLDPAVRARGKLLKRWGLLVNITDRGE